MVEDVLVLGDSVDLASAKLVLILVVVEDVLVLVEVKPNITSIGVLILVVVEDVLVHDKAVY